MFKYSAAIIDTEHVRQSARCSIIEVKAIVSLCVRLYSDRKKRGLHANSPTRRCNFKHEEVDVVPLARKIKHDGLITLLDLPPRSSLMHDPRDSLMRFSPPPHSSDTALTFCEFMEMCHALTFRTDAGIRHHTRHDSPGDSGENVPARFVRVQRRPLLGHTCNSMNRLIVQFA